jgi:MFS family permease
MSRTNNTEREPLLGNGQDTQSKPISWDDDQDPQNPRNWPNRQKGLIGFILTAIAIVSYHSHFSELTCRTLSGVMFAPALRSVLADFGSTSETLAAMCISIFVAGYAIGPLFWAPLSELYGRRIVNNWSNILFLATEVASGAAPSLTFLIIVRFLGGLFSSARFVLGGAIINDVIDAEHQGKLMAILNFGGTVCSVFGPMVYVSLAAV